MIRRRPPAHRIVASSRCALVVIFFTALGTVASTTVCERVAHAQSDQRKARKAFADAKQAYSADKFSEAAALFKKAYRFDPKPQLLFNIAQSLREAGNLVEAETFYKRYLDELPRATNREAVLGTLFELQQQVAMQLAIVTVESDIVGLDVYIDDETTPRCKTPCIVNVNPGPHTISVDGQNVDRATQNIEAEAQQELTIQLASTSIEASAGQLMVTTNVTGGVLTIDGKPAGRLPLKEAISLPPGAYPLGVLVGGELKWRGSAQISAGKPTAIDAQISAGDSGAAPGVESRSFSTPAVLCLGVGVAALGAGTFFGLSAQSVESDLDAQLGRGETPNKELISHGEDQSLYANIFFATGAVAVGTGFLLYLLDGEDDGDAVSMSSDVILLRDGALIRIQTPF